ncbi:unnamed protein product [Chondrus crispus]|uniref:Sulfotransferase domain-containing protein n=1 Tax=Chondrus crispus TaxID=2769 RepID=R7Q4U7_CHOCR|nr:unnamed protein product [Chondrus crispus]CDF32893.1 unnamed protein product [Chondrus crispus]|eukprot:XP_005712694.1 unnamed protein product [Chondrus crispus]
MALHKSHSASRPLCFVMALAGLALLLFGLLFNLGSHMLPVASCPPPRVRVSTERKAKPLPRCAKPNADGVVPRAKTFLIVFMGNSASTAISLDLRNHPDVHMDVLEMVDLPGYDNTTEALAHVRRFFDEGIAMGKIPGFKIRPKHILAMREEWAALAREYDTHLFWQYRKNTLKSALTSYIKYEVAGGDNVNVGGMKKNVSIEERCQMGKGCKHHIDVDSFYARLRGQLDWTNTVTEAVRVMDDARGCVWEAPYEEYLEDRETFNTNMQRFLGIKEMAVKQERWKGTGDGVCDVVENWDELCEKLYGCVIWQPLLEDPKNGCFCNTFGTGTDAYCRTDKDRKKK